MKKKFQILVTYLYISPEGTYPSDIKPTTQVNTAIFTSTNKKIAVKKALDFVEQHFDGLETFRKTFRPEIHKHFSEKNPAAYFLDDDSAGQLAVFIEPKNGTASIEL